MHTLQLDVLRTDVDKAADHTTDCHAKLVAEELPALQRKCDERIQQLDKRVQGFFDGLSLTHDEVLLVQQDLSVLATQRDLESVQADLESVRQEMADARSAWTDSRPQARQQMAPSNQQMSTELQKLLHEQVGLRGRRETGKGIVVGRRRFRVPSTRGGSVSCVWGRGEGRREGGGERRLGGVGRSGEGSGGVRRGRGEGGKRARVRPRMPSHDRIRVNIGTTSNYGQTSSSLLHNNSKTVQKICSLQSSEVLHDFPPPSRRVAMKVATTISPGT